MLRGVQIDLGDARRRSAAARGAAGGDRRHRRRASSAHYDAKTERYRLVIERTRHGNVRSDARSTTSSSLRRLRADPRSRRVLHGLVGEGAYVQRGEKKQRGARLRRGDGWLLAEVESSVAMQRYKGLGEMNPEQLWETTMDPACGAC